MRRGLALLAAGLLAASPAAAVAGAWPLEPGRTQAILKYEDARADQGFDPDGALVPIGARTDRALSLFLEHGLTARLTAQAKVSAVEGRDPFVRYEGAGPVELGLRALLWRDRRTVVSVYAGAMAAGAGRNAGYAAPGAGDYDAELRLLAGRTGTWRRRPVFGEVQAARLWRQGLPDETRVDLTVGGEPARRWLVLAQLYAGQAEAPARPGAVAPRWAKAELSLVRHLGPWSVQAGWRGAVAGRESPAEQGPVIGLWRRF